jgi:hypothetical protein
MTVPARYTLTEAHFKIAELEREKAWLQQALKARHRWLADALSRNQIVHETDRARARAFIADWEALAGPDTPAIPPRPPMQPPGHQREMADTPADSQEDKT